MEFETTNDSVLELWPAEHAAAVEKFRLKKSKHCGIDARAMSWKYSFCDEYQGLTHWFRLPDGRTAEEFYTKKPLSSGELFELWEAHMLKKYTLNVTASYLSLTPVIVPITSAKVMPPIILKGLKKYAVTRSKRSILNWEDMSERRVADEVKAKRAEVQYSKVLGSYCGETSWSEVESAIKALESFDSENPDMEIISNASEHLRIAKLLAEEFRRGIGYAEVKSCNSPFLAGLSGNEYRERINGMPRGNDG